MLFLRRKILIFLFSSFIPAIDLVAATWNLNANGNWNVNGNWTAPATFPNAIDETAIFGNAINANRTISLGTGAQNIIIGTMNIDDNNNYIIQSGLAGNRLFFDVTLGNARLNLTNVNGSGLHSITCPMTLNDPFFMSHLSTANFTLSGAITGVGSLNKIGSGTGVLILSNLNSYSGGTNIQEGRLQYSANGALPAGSNVTIGDGIGPVNSAILTMATSMTSSASGFNALINTDGSLVQNSGVSVFLNSLQGTGRVTLSTGTTDSNFLDITTASDITYSGIVGGGSANASTNPTVGNRILKHGAGTLTFDSSNTHSSRIFIEGGIINASHNIALGVAGANTGTFVESGTSLYLNNSITLPERIFLNGIGVGSTGALRNQTGNNILSGIVQVGWAGGSQVSAPATIQVDSGTSLNFNNVLSGTQTLNKTESGTLILSGGISNTLTSPIIVTNGTLRLQKNAGFVASVGTVQVDSLGTLSLMDNNQTINSLNVNGGTVTQNGLVLNLTGTSPLTLTMDDGTSLTGPIAFTSTGGVTYTGTTTRATVSGNVNLGASAHSFNIADGADSVDMELSGVISGTGSINKVTSSGVLQFSGAAANTYTGLTTINAGELRLNKDPGINALAGNLTINTGGAVRLEANDQIINTSLVTLSGGTFNLNGKSETINQLTFTSGTYLPGTLTLQSNSTALSLGNGVAVSGTINLVSSGLIAYTGASATSTISGILDLGASTHSLSVNPGTASTDLLINGAISGNGGINTTALGLLEYAGSASNTYTGLTTHSKGTLLLNKDAGFIAIAGNVLMNDNDGRLELGNNNQFSDTSNFTLASATANFNMNGFSTRMGSFFFNSGVVAAAGGTLDLVAAGPGTALRMQAGTTLGAGVNILNGGAINFDNAGTSALAATLSGPLNLGTITPIFNIENEAIAVDLEVSGQISSSGAGLTKTGSGTLLFSGAQANTYTGLTTLTDGLLQLNKTIGPAIPGNLTLNGGDLILLAGNQISNTSIVTLTNSNSDFNLNGFNDTIGTLIFNDGTLTQAGGTLSLNDGTNALRIMNRTISGAIAITNGGSVVFDATNNGTATLSGTVDLGSSSTPIAFSIANGSATSDMQVSGNLIGTGGGLTKIGPGRLTFLGSAPNTYTGITTVAEGELRLSKIAGINAIPGDVLINGGILRLDTANQLPNTSIVTLSSGTFNLNGNADTIGTFIFNGGTFIQGGATLSLFNASTALSMRDTSITENIAILNGGSVVFDATNNGTAVLSGTVDLGSSITPITFNVANGLSATDMDVSGSLRGNGGGLTKIGAGRLTFSGAAANTYTGTTTVATGELFLSKTANVTAIPGDVIIDGGVLTLGASNQIPDISTVTLSGGTYNMEGFDDTIGTFIFNSGAFNQNGSILSLANASMALSMRNTTISGNISILNGGSVNFDATNNGTAIISGNMNLEGGSLSFNINEGSAQTDMLIDGVISNGGLIKDGPGTLVLTGANTYTSGTTINAGTLQGNTTSLQGSIIDNGRLVFDQSFAHVFAGTIAGTGTLVKQGAGTLTLVTENSVGSASVNQGKLIVNGSLEGGGNLFVASGATLGGTGTIIQNSLISGILDPGNSIGTIHFVGDQTFANGSTLFIEITPSSNDLVDVVGTVTIQPGSTISINAHLADYTIPVLYKIVQTTDGVFGRFSQVISQYPLFLGIPLYNANDIFLQVTFAKFVNFFSSGNAGQVAKCLDSLPSAPGSDLFNVINDLRLLPTEAAIKEALLQLQPSQFTALAIAQEDNTLYVKNSINNRLDERFLVPYCQCNLPDIWGSVFISNTEQKYYKDEPGFKAKSPGIMIGFDNYWRNSACYGGSIGYSYTNLNWKDQRGKAKIQSGYAVLYGGMKNSLGYIQGSIIGETNHYYTDRYMDIDSFRGIDRHAKGRHSGSVGAINIKAALTLDNFGLIFSPFVDLGYQYLYENGFKEHGASILNLNVKNKISDLLTSEFGIHISNCSFTSMSRISSYLQLSVIRESRFRGETEEGYLADCCLLTVKGLSPSRTLGAATVGLNFDLCNKTELSFFYRGKCGTGFQDHSLNVQYSF